MPIKILRIVMLTLLYSARPVALVTATEQGRGNLSKTCRFPTRRIQGTIASARRGRTYEDTSCSAAADWIGDGGGCDPQREFLADLFIRDEDSLYRWLLRRPVR